MNAAREAQWEGSIKTAGSQTTPGTWKKPRERTRPASWSNPDVPPTWRAMQNLGSSTAHPNAAVRSCSQRGGRPSGMSKYGKGRQCSAMAKKTGMRLDLYMREGDTIIAAEPYH